MPRSKSIHIYVLSGTWAIWAQHEEWISPFSRPPAQSCTPEGFKAFKLIIILNGAPNPTFPTKSLTQKTNGKMLQVNQPVADPRSQQKEQAEFLTGSPQRSLNNNAAIRLLL